MDRKGSGMIVKLMMFSTMTIIYSCIATSSTILCSSEAQQSTSTHCERMADSVLKKLTTQNDGKFSVIIESHKLHCKLENEVIFICIAPSDFPTSPCMVFLTQVRDQFKRSKFYGKVMTAERHQLDTKLRPLLNKLMEKYSNPEAGDQVYLLQDKVEEVTAAMLQNIEGVMQRRLMDLEDKTAQVRAASGAFLLNASKLKKKSRRRNLKICAGFVFFLLIGAALYIVLGSGIIDIIGEDGRTVTTPSTILTT